MRNNAPGGNFQVSHCLALWIRIWDGEFVKCRAKKRAMVENNSGGVAVVSESSRRQAHYEFSDSFACLSTHLITTERGVNDNG